MRVGDRALFTLYNDVVGTVTLVANVGSASDAYQWAVKADDGRDFVASEDELEILKWD
jgi:hypothetical protein